MEHLSIKDIHDRLEQLNGWEMTGDELVKEFSFENFKDAIKFVNQVGEEAQRNAHYPRILINEDIVTIILTTPEANGVTISLTIGLTTCMYFEFEFNLSITSCSCDDPC